MKTILAWNLTLAILAMVATTCGGDGSPASPQASPESGQVRGLVQEAQGAPFGVPDHFIVEDGEGQVWEFSVESTGEFNTAHMREHMQQGLPVTVYFRSTPDGLIAVQVTD